MPPLASLTPSLILTVVFGPPPTRRQQRCGAARAGSYQTEEHHAQRSSELSEGLLSKALRDVRSGRLQENRAALLYGIPPPGILRSQLEAPGPIQREDVTSRDVTSSARGEEVRLVLQRVAAWAERGRRTERCSSFPPLSCRGLCLGLYLPRLREDLYLRIPQVKSRSRPALPLPEPCSLAEALALPP